MANAITICRIIISIVMLFFPAFSPAFYCSYLLAGITDVLDGFVARKTDTVSTFGSKLDTAADIVFVAAVIIKCAPTVELPAWLIIWFAAIAIIKIANIVYGFLKYGELISVHSVLNKITGGLLFVLPLTLSFIDITYSGSWVCIAATVAAINETVIVVRGMQM